MRINLKKILSVLLLLLLVLPFIQQQFRLFEFKPLYGFFNTAAKPEFALKTWFDGSWQLQMDDYTKDNIGFRPFFLRLQNQISYSMFTKAPNKGILIGKEGVLYQNDYIDALYGNDFVGTNKLAKQIQKLKIIQSKLEEKGVDLLIVLVPGKASIYPEYIPELFRKEESDSTNYKILIKALNDYHIDHLDFRDYFLEIKDKVKYPLYPKNGTHWSGYGLTFAADTLFKFVSEKYNYNLMKFKFLPGYETDKKFRYTDNDLEKILNLFQDLNSWKLYYPSIQFEKGLYYKPSAYIVGDSYIQSFINFYPIYDSVFSKSSMLWLKYTDLIWPVYKPDYDKSRMRNDLINKDIVILEATEINYDNLAFGFINEAYFFLTSDSLEYDRLMNHYSQAIKRNPKWMDWVRKRAITRKNTLDEEIRLNAAWMIQQDIIKKD